MNSTETPKVGIPKPGIPRAGIPKLGKTHTGLAPEMLVAMPSNSRCDKGKSVINLSNGFKKALRGGFL